MKISVFILNRDHTLTVKKVVRGERLFKYAGGKYAISMTAELVRKHSAKVEPMLVYREGNAAPWGVKDKTEITRFTWRKRTLQQLSGMGPGFKFPQWAKSIFSIKTLPVILIALALLYHFLGGG